MRTCTKHHRFFLFLWWFFHIEVRSIYPRGLRLCDYIFCYRAVRVLLLAGSLLTDSAYTWRNTIQNYEDIQQQISFIILRIEQQRKYTCVCRPRCTMIGWSCAA